MINTVGKNRFLHGIYVERERVCQRPNHALMEQSNQYVRRRYRAD